MPIPVSCTAMRTSSSSIRAITFTSPCGVNLMPLVKRLRTICFTFCRSERTSGAPCWRSVSTCSFAFWISGSTSDSSSPISAGSSNSSTWSGILPASMRLMSRMSLMMESRWRELESTRSSLFFCGGVSSPETPCKSMLV